MKKILSLVLTLCLLLSALPLNFAFAEDTEAAAEAEAAVEVTAEEPEEPEAPAKSEPAKEPEKPAEEKPAKAEPAPAAPEKADEPAAPAEEVPKAEEAQPEEEAPAQEEAPAKEEAPAQEEAQESAAAPEAVPQEEETPAEPEVTEPAAEPAELEITEPAAEPAEAEEPELPDEELTEKAKPATPTGLKVDSGGFDTATGAFKVTLSWNVVSGCTYTLYANDGTGIKEIANDISGLTYTVKNLTCGLEYSFYVQAVNGTSKSDRSEPVRHTPKPAAPTGLALTQNPSKTVTLIWTQVDGANGYNVYKSVDGTPFALLFTSNSKTNTTFADKNVTMGQFVEYKVMAFRNVGEGTVEGDDIKRTIDLKPLPVQNVTVKASGSSSATVQWDALVGAESYIVLRTTTDGGVGQPVATGLTVTTYEDAGLTVGSPYYYSVVAVIDGVEGEASAVVSYTQEVANVTGLAVKAQTATTITLKWDQDPTATRYKLEYKAASGSPSTFVEMGSSGDINHNVKITDNVAEYTVKNLTPSTVYYFRISAVVKVGATEQVGNASPEVIGATTPTPVTDLAVNDFDYNFVELVWTEGTFSGQVEIYRADGTSAAKKIDTIASGVEKYKDETVVCGTKYTYYVRTLVKITTPQALELRSEPSNEVSEKPRNRAPASATATSLNATSITVEWAQVTGAHGYRVRTRGVGEDDFTNAKYVTGEANLSVVVENLIPGKQYEFEVCAYRTVNGTKIIGEKIITAGCRPVPEAPKTIKVKVLDATSLKVTWTKLENVAGYYVYIEEEDGVEKGTFTFYGKFPVDTNSYEAHELKTGRIYKFSVCGYVKDPDDLVREGVYTDITLDEAKGKPIPPAPTNFGGTSVDSHTILLGWNAVALGDVANSGYYIQKSSNGLTYSDLCYIYSQSVTEYEHQDGSKACDTRWYKLYSMIPCEGKIVLSEPVLFEITPVPATATNLELSSSKTTEIVLTFDGEQTATYYVWRREGSGGWVKQTGSPVWVTDHWEYTDTTVQKAVDYSYRVKPAVKVGSITYEGKYSAATALFKSRPAQNTTVVATCKSAVKIRLDYDAVTDAVGYQIQRSDMPDSGYATLGTSAKLFYTDSTAVTGKTYFYRIRAYYTYGSGSKRYGDWTYLDAPQDTLGVMAVPMPPTKFVVASKTYNSVTLTWKKTTGTNCHYRLTYDNLTDSITDVVVSDKITLDKETYTVKNLEVGKKYTFHIYTVCKLDDGSEMVSAAEDALDDGSTTVTIVPEKVITVKLASLPPADGDPTKLYNRVAWDPVNGASAYNIYRRKQSDTTASKITSTPVTSSPYFDTSTSFAVGDIYYYSVAAVGPGSVEGERSDEKKITVKPTPVTGLKVESAGPTKLKVSWDDMSVTKYQIYRSTTAGALGSLVKTTTSLTWTNTGLTCGTTYYFTVKAVKVDGSISYVSAKGTQVEGTPLPLQPTLASPTQSTCLKAKLTWSSVAGASGYQMGYRIAGGDPAWIEGGTVSGKTNGKVKVKLTKKNYEFAVRAYTDVNGSRKYGPWSDPSVQLQLIPKDITGLASGTKSTDNIPISWTAKGDVTGYHIYTCEKVDGEYKLVGSSTTNSYKITGTTPGRLIYIKVTCYVSQEGGEVESDLATAAPISSWRKLAKPVLSLGTYNNTSCTINWKKISGDVSGFEIRAKYSGGSNTTIDIINTGTQTSYVHEKTNAYLVYSNSKEIIYQVRAYVIQSDGSKRYSAWSDALTKPKK